MSRCIIVFIFLGLLSCQTDRPNESEEVEYSGVVESKDTSIWQILSPDSELEILGEGFIWSEGPLWLEEADMLIFSDVPSNKVYQWKEGEGVSVYMSQAGNPEDDPKKREAGANGLALDQQGRLILCQHGYRRVAMMEASISDPRPEFTALASQYNGKKFNSPNDLHVASNGNIFFTDPPYGLFDPEDAELDYFGVFRVDADGEVHLLIDSLTRPNGISMSPDERTLYVAVSDPEKSAYYAYQLNDNQDIISGGLLLDVTPLLSDEYKGFPDGLKVRSDGIIFATGPGGVLVINPSGKHLGTILTGKATANLAFNRDTTALFMTAHDQLMRITLVP